MTGLGYVDPMPTVLDVRPADRDGPTEAGRLLRSWRERRRLSQLELAGRAGVSARHLSFVETGRSRPTAEMVLRLCGRLDVPLTSMIVYES